jgi:glycosyltransferase involved in cell wall biosynthesis
MKIVYFIDHLRADGSPFVLNQLVEGLGKRGHQQTVFCLNDSWDEVNVRKLQNQNAQVKIIGKFALISGFGLLRVWRSLQKLQADAVVTMLFASDIIGRWISRLAHVPRIVTSIQTHDVYYSTLQRWLVRRSMPCADVVLLNSQHIAEFAIREEGATSDKLQVIHNSIRYGDYQVEADKEALHKELNIPSSGFILGSLGRLTPQKGYDVLINALAAIPWQDLHVVIAGTGEQKDALLSLASHQRVGDRVHLVGYRRDVPYFLKAIDLYVHPSRYEGMPIAVLEAMAAGCPIVASGVDGIRELIEDGVHGWLVPPEEPARLGRTILRAMQQPGERLQRGEAARARARDHFNVDEMIVTWEKVLLGA